MKEVKHTGTAEEIEASINDTIQEGWRYVSSYEGYICPDCKGADPMYEAFCGKIKKASKIVSYSKLLQDIYCFMEWM